nr:hypothetical protein [Rhodococcus sp. (in: high G+C Gram-positive bacteria)]
MAIIDVDLGAVRKGDIEEPRTPESAAEYLASTMLWNLWPRMIADVDNRLRCSVKFEGFPVDIPDPESTIELRPFVDAYRRLSRDGEYDVPSRRAKPQEIGRFAKVESMAPITKNRLLALAAPFSGAAHHCARMRQADLVVDYVAGDPHPTESVQYGAVFKTGVEADQYFADAEPPTHDDWVTSGLHGTALGVVRLGASYVRGNLKPSLPDAEPDQQHDAALAPLAGRLSGLVSGATADGATASERRGGKRSGRAGGRAASRPKIVEGPKLTVLNGEALVVATVELPAWPTAKSVTAEALVVVEGGTEQPGVLEPAVVLGWSSSESGEKRLGRSATIAREDSRIWTVSVRPPKDTVIRLAFSVEDEG